MQVSVKEFRSNDVSRPIIKKNMRTFNRMIVFALFLTMFFSSLMTMNIKEHGSSQSTQSVFIVSFSFFMCFTMLFPAFGIRRFNLIVTSLLFDERGVMIRTHKGGMKFLTKGEFDIESQEFALQVKKHGEKYDSLTIRHKGFIYYVPSLFFNDFNEIKDHLFRYSRT